MREPKDPTLREIRTHANLKQSELADKMRIDHSLISLKEVRYTLNDLPLFLIRNWVEACGGKLTITIEMPGMDDIIR